MKQRVESVGSTINMSKAIDQAYKLLKPTIGLLWQILSRPNAWKLQSVQLPGRYRET